MSFPNNFIVFTIMNIPQKIKSCLERKPSQLHHVLAAIDQFSPWINNTLPLFPEYTDHGPQHVEDVLNSAVGLIAKSAWSKLSSTDAMVLSLSVLLHDCAMHLTEYGFVSLVKSRSVWQPIDGFHDKPWDQLWSDFLMEARHFDAHTLNRLFGNSDSVRDPPMVPQEMTEKDRMLIGEFIRRYHPRLAHEIALYGFPGPDGDFEPMFTGIDKQWLDLIGLTARSHGFPLRQSFGYLKNKFHLREFRNTHAVYIMVLLRLADFLQIQAQRAPKAILLTKRLNSPFSLGEWKTHQAIDNITSSTEDPDAIQIDARPEDAKTYLKIKSWLNGLQGELDTSWAVLGEVYGLQKDLGLDQLILSLRRIRSNLDDHKKFSGQVGYVPERINFSTANAELLQLLVGPLYGNNPGSGMRELIMNAVDAVRELIKFVSDHPEYGSKERNSLEIWYP